MGADPRLQLRDIQLDQSYVVYSYTRNIHVKEEPQTKEQNLFFYVGVIGGSLLGVCCIFALGGLRAKERGTCNDLVSTVALPDRARTQLLQLCCCLLALHGIATCVFLLRRRPVGSEKHGQHHCSH